MTDHTAETEVPTAETTPHLSQAGYTANVTTLVERTLTEFTDDEGRPIEFDATDIRQLFGDLGTIAETFPFSVIEYGDHRPTPGAWAWIDDAEPTSALEHLARDILAGDVESR